MVEAEVSRRYVSDGFVGFIGRNAAKISPQSPGG